MVKNKRNQSVKMLKKGTKGITLIALVITIIVLIILAAVSIAMLTGESGILTQAQNAKKETITGQEKEQVEVAYVSATANKLGYNVTADELQANLEKNVGKNKTETAECENGLIVKFMDTTNFYVVENETGKVEKTVAQLINKKIEVTSSEQSIIFSNTITQKDVDAISGKRNTNFEIIGIGTSKDKSAEFLKSATGKSGNIEIQGENSSATFKYTLTNFMQGDEEFFVKCKIGEEEYIQTLNVIQGDEVIYEEDFVGFEYVNDWNDDLNDNYSNGKAKKASATNGTEPQVLANFSGTKYEIVTRADDLTGTTIFKVVSPTTYNNIITYIGGKGDGSISYNVKFQKEFEKNSQINLTMKVTTQAFPKVDFYLDALIVHK